MNEKSNNPNYIRIIPKKCSRCGGNIMRDGDNKYQCLQCGREYNWENKQIGGKR